MLSSMLPTSEVEGRSFTIVCTVFSSSTICNRWMDGLIHDHKNDEQTNVLKTNSSITTAAGRIDGR